MTSEMGQSECFVYITLPGQTEPVTAGRFVLTKDRHGVSVGQFIYGRSYKDRPDAVELDPAELKLAPRTYETTALGGVFGALRDAGPDYWGRRVIERHAGRAQLGELDYLMQSPDDRAGALGFGIGQQPPAPRRDFNQTLDLEKLLVIADAIISEEDVSPDAVAGPIEELLLVGTSMGGARPKAVVEDDDGLWIAKFSCPDDKWNQVRVEHSMLLLACDCGLTVSQSRVITIGVRDVLLVKRFDREKTDAGYLRARMISSLTLLRAEDSHRSRNRWSYVLLAEELRRTCAEPKKQANELFRRMCFSALISNTDDHPRNHAIIAKDRDWKLSPAYDLTPSAPVSLEQRDLALTCGDQGRFANMENLLSQCERFLLNREQAKAIIAEMEEVVGKSWYIVMRSTGVTERDCDLLKGAFVYPGFKQSRS